MIKIFIFLFLFQSFQMYSQEISDIKVKVFVDNIEQKNIDVKIFIKTDSTIYSYIELKEKEHLDSVFFTKIRSLIISIGNDSLEFLSYASYMEHFFEMGVNQYRDILTQKSNSNWMLEINHYPFNDRRKTSDSVNKTLYSKEEIDQHAERLLITKEEIVNCNVIIGETMFINFRKEFNVK
jgi:hypothetical protein